MDLIHVVKQESLDIEDDDVDSSEVEYPQNLLQDIPAQETLMPVPVKLVEVSTGKEVPFQETGDVVLPDLAEGSLLCCHVKTEKESKHELEENFQVFPESIVAVKMEAEDGGGVEERNIDCYNKITFNPVKLEIEENDIHSRDQKRERTDFVDACSPQSSKCMRYVKCAGQEEELNLDSFQYSEEDVAQHKKGKHTMKSTCEKRDLKCEDIEMMASKEAEVKNEVLWQSENNGKEADDEEGLSDLSISIVKRSIKKRCVIREREDGFKCHHCGDRRETKEKIAEHIQLVHGFGSEEEKDPRNELPINECSEKMKKGIGEHSRVGSNAKRHICNICEKRFTRNGTLKIHMRIHSGEKPFKCSVCGYRSSRNGHLKTHMRTHTSEKPYKCSICDYSCTTNGNLKTHMRIHSGEKPFKCSLCNYRSKRGGDLKTHMRSHRVELPYKCSVWDYK